MPPNDPIIKFMMIIVYEAIGNHVIVNVVKISNGPIFCVEDRIRIIVQDCE